MARRSPDLEKLTTEVPDYRDAARKFQFARQQARLQALYADATRQSQAGQWQAVVDSFAQIAKLQADYPDSNNLLATARAQLAAQGQQEKLAALYRDALQAIEKKRWSEAQRLMEQILKLEPGYRNAPRLLEKVREEAAHGNGKLRGWLVGAAVVGLAVLGVGGVIFAWINSLGVTGMVSPITASVTPIAISRPPAGMVLIPAGPFKMGNPDPQAALAKCKKDASNCSIDWFQDETPAHPVTLNAFLMDVYEVTNANYAQCVTAGKCKVPTDKTSFTRKDYYENEQYANYPVVNVSWEDAKTYCEWRGVRLPSEAEWEKAARGGLEGKLYPWGDTTPICTSDVENSAQFAICPVKDSVSVGSFKPNGYGLFDMAGNAWEWVNDWYHSRYYNSSPGNNPTGPIEGLYKVVRGSGWDSDLDSVRVAHRFYFTPADRYYSLGFRCVATLKSPE